MSLRYADIYPSRPPNSRALLSLTDGNFSNLFFDGGRTSWVYNHPRKKEEKSFFTYSPSFFTTTKTTSFLANDLTVPFCERERNISRFCIREG